jgi:hypothetical protein
MAHKAILAPSHIAVLSSQRSQSDRRLGSPLCCYPRSPGPGPSLRWPTYFYRDGLEPMNTPFEAIAHRIFVGEDDQGFPDFGDT